MTTRLHLDVDHLRQAIQAEYATVATCPTQGFHFHTGRYLAELLGYDPTVLNRLPEQAIESFAGVGNPFSLGSLKPGETVLDVGCGSGLDSLIAAQQVGPSGNVVGIDMTDAMLAKARENAAAVTTTNIEFRRGIAEEIPSADTAFDVVISNGVINLCPDKVAVFREISRVLKPGGRFQAADIVVEKEVPHEAKENIELWTG